MAASKPAPDGSARLAPGLYLVGTPIGNLGDMTPRARAILVAADIVAAEDTRTARRLASALGERFGRLVAYHDHNEAEATPRLVEAIREGAAVAVISEAGMPMIADPGHRLVRACVESDLPVSVVPGPSAVPAALALSGLPVDRFHFAGFVPRGGADRRRLLEELRPLRAALVFFEAPGRLAGTLDRLAEALGSRDAAVCREMTKLHEEVVRGPLEALGARFAEAPPRGEVVIVVAPPDAAEHAVDDETLDRALDEALDRLSLRDAAAEVASALGVSRKHAYQRALARKKG